MKTQQLQIKCKENHVYIEETTHVQNRRHSVDLGSKLYLDLNVTI